MAGDLAQVNFERSPELVACFAPNDPREVLTLLEARLRRPIVPGKTLLFLDEIQAQPGVLAKLRWFAEELPGLAVIAAGSLLDFALSEAAFSVPVGRLSYAHMEPMTFREFLRACGEDRLEHEIAEASPTAPVPSALHDRLMELGRAFAFVGGMPAAVRAWTESRSILNVTEVHRDLLQSIRDDFAKYRRNANAVRIEKVFAALPRLVGRKFKASVVDRDERSGTIKDAFRMLTLARIATPVRASACNGVPLGAEVDDAYQKVCLLDVGLFVTMTGLDPAAVLTAPDLTLVNEGQIAKQWVGQELRAARPVSQEPALFTWVREARNSNAEVDYVVQVGGRIVPVEVKAGAAGSLRGLHMMIREKQLDLGVKVSAAPQRMDQVMTALPDGKQVSFRLLTVPFYMTSEIPRLCMALDQASTNAQTKKRTRSPRGAKKKAS